MSDESNLPSIRIVKIRHLQDWEKESTDLFVSAETSEKAYSQIKKLIRLTQKLKT